MTAIYGKTGFGTIGYGKVKAKQKQGRAANVSSNDIIILDCNLQCIAGRLTGLMTDGLTGVEFRFS